MSVVTECDANIGLEKIYEKIRFLGYYVYLRPQTEIKVIIIRVNKIK